MLKKSLWVAFALLMFVSQIEAQDSITIAKDGKYNLSEAKVEATRMGMSLKSIPQKVELIDKDKIATIPADNAADLLKTITNLDIIQYPGASAQIGMRGFSPSAHSRSYTIVLIDGLPSGTSNLATLPTSLIERIEVVKGPYSLLYGTDVMGGAINIITQKASDDKKANVALKAGSFGSVSFDGTAGGMLSEKVGLVLGFTSKAQTKDYRIGANNLLKTTEVEKLLLDKKSYGDIYPNTTYQTNQLFGKLQYEIDTNWHISLSSMYYAGYDIKTPGNYFTQQPGKKDINRFNVFGSIMYKTTNNTLEVAPYFSTEDNAHYDTHENTTTNFISFRDNIKEFGVKTTNTLTINNFKVLAGIDYDVWDYTSNRQSAKGTEAAPYKPNNRNQRASGFAQLNYEWRGLSVNAGARANFIRYDVFKHDSLNNSSSKHNYFYFVPSLGAKYNFLKGFNVHASAGRAFSIPDAFATYGFYEVNTLIGTYQFRRVYVGNADLQPETSVTYEAGVGYGNSFLNLDITYFQTIHDNKIVTNVHRGVSGAPDTTFYNNAKSARMSGLEVMGALNIAQLIGWKQKLEIYGNLTYMFVNNFTEYGTDKIKELLYVNKANANFGIYYDNMKGFSTRLHARYKGSRLENNVISSRLRPLLTEDNYYTGGGYEASNKIYKLPDHLIFDYSIFYNVTRNAKIGITISNLFDENYTEKDGYNMPGRSIMGHVSYSF